MARGVSAFSSILVMAKLPRRGGTIVCVGRTGARGVIHFRADLPIGALGGTVSVVRCIASGGCTFKCRLGLSHFAKGSAHVDSVLAVPLIGVRAPGVRTEIPRGFSRGLHRINRGRLSAGILKVFNYSPGAMEDCASTRGSHVLLTSSEEVILDSSNVVRFVAGKRGDKVSVAKSAIRARSGTLCVTVSNAFGAVLNVFRVAKASVGGTSCRVGLAGVAYSRSCRGRVYLDFSCCVGNRIVRCVSRPKTRTVRTMVSGKQLISFGVRLGGFIGANRAISGTRVLATVSRCYDGRNSGRGVCVCSDCLCCNCGGGGRGVRAD